MQNLRTINLNSCLIHKTRPDNDRRPFVASSKFFIEIGGEAPQGRPVHGCLQLHPTTISFSPASSIGISWTPLNP